MTEFEREQRGETLRAKRHGTKKFFMGALMAVLVAGGAFVLLTSRPSETDQLAQQEISASTFTPTAVPTPNTLPPVPLPDATPVPNTKAPAPATPAVDPMPSAPTP